MRRKLLTLGMLVMAVGLIGLTGCSRQAQVREEQPAEQMSSEQTSIARTPTTMVQAEPGSETVGPMPGETVVSAVSPTPAPTTPVAGEQPASATAAGLAPTVEPVAPIEPAANPTATKTASAAEVAPTSQDSVSSGAEQPVVHKVRKGETLSGIAQRYGTTTRAIAKANGISDSSTIIPGQTLKIQASGDSSGESSSDDSQTSVCRKKHKVKRGEWVWQIARKYDVPPKEIMAANNLTSRKAKTLQPGTVLCIP